MTTMTETTPRAWIGSLAAYNAGRLIGKWCDLDGRDAGEIEEEAREAMRPMLGGMSEAEAFDEIWCFDHEGLTGLVSGECNVSEAVEAAAVLAEVDESEADAFLAYVANLGPSNVDRDSVVDDFREAYAGEWDSMEAYAAELIEETGLLNEVPESLRYYIDYEAYGRDLVIGGDYYTSGAGGGRVYVFRSL